MPSRRSILATTGTVATTTVAGCSSFGRPDGSPGEIRPDRDLRPADGNIVARASAEKIGCPRGDIELLAVAFEPPKEALQILTKIDVFSGQRECESDWTHNGIHVTHSWGKLGLETKSAVTDTASNVVYSDTGGDVRLENQSNSQTGEWKVDRTANPGETEQYNFRSTYTVGDVAGNDDPLVSEGEKLGTVTVDVPLSTGGLLGGQSETITRTRTLVYGQTKEQE